MKTIKKTILSIVSHLALLFSVSFSITASKSVEEQGSKGKIETFSILQKIEKIKKEGDESSDGMDLELVEETNLSDQEEDDLGKFMREYDTNKEARQKEVIQLKKEVEKLKKEKQQQDKKITKFEQDIEKIDQERKKFEEYMKKFKQESEKQNIRIATLNKYVVTLKDKNTTYENNIKKLEAKQETLLKELEDKGNLIQELKAIKKGLEEKVERIAKKETKTDQEEQGI
ncbi:MAG: hypothetical protein AAF770_01220, partial [Bacteroidota bacterium]